MNNSAQTVKKSKFPRVVTAPKRARSSNNVSFADKIPFIRSLILESVKPGVIKKIYLFGSYAYGTATEDSDIDLCVVINNRFNRLNANVKISQNLFENKIRPVDLLVYKENQFLNITNPNGIENTIVKEGKVLYG
jgi:predicted nucleotidyltransferase